MVVIASQVQFDMKTEFRQAGKQNLFGTRPNWVVSLYSLYKKFHSPGQIFTHIIEWASTSFPAC